MLFKLSHTVRAKILCLVYTKMTQNGLKWILNITFKTVKFFWFDPPPTVKNFTDFFFFNEGFP